MDIISFVQAVSDVSLELLLTTLLVFIMLILGVVIGRWSLRQELKEATYHQIDKTRKAWWNNFLQGISTELFGAFITTIGFGLILVIFQQYQSIQNDKADLILQMGSPNHAFAIEAVRIANNKGWLTDEKFLFNANLSGADLSGAELSGVDLRFADLSGVDLSEADLSNANLSGANLFEAILTRTDLGDANLSYAQLFDSDLSGASLDNVDLSRAVLVGADLFNVDLFGANLYLTNLSFTSLRGADLRLADLRFASLFNTSLRGADLLLADLSEVDLGGAELPDGTQWTEGTDMTRFTDENHPNFWQPPENE